MQPVEDQDGSTLRYVLSSRPEAVRETLGDIRNALIQRGVRAEKLGPCELVLAEAMNNIVEHAYKDADNGEIRITLSLDATHLKARIEDSGGMMPQSSLPTGEMKSVDVALADLPEGGFGWFLIRSMTDELRYRRKDGINLLDFSIPIKDAD
ncbi:ATP-binding protein [Primorskyibacter sp. 2E107]|uniref:ATP-binding protein n=1 Tax=Primorskyibacter sp. 2E107 TaxID=3403458 RepID=UPI003AF42706